ncbi:hypothetical protein [Hymenobacter swuensis]|uniref:hypothetical protein n=1 Tax=Hymenobacter swuensis TaxID=1446467 RepID=UPI0012DFB5F4|nr:hypothetical protein [Hymenobacter swuensis]
MTRKRIVLECIGGICIISFGFWKYSEIQRQINFIKENGVFKKAIIADVNYTKGWIGKVVIDHDDSIYLRRMNFSKKMHEGDSIAVIFSEADEADFVLTADSTTEE